MSEPEARVPVFFPRLFSSRQVRFVSNVNHARQRYWCNQGIMPGQAWEKGAQQRRFDLWTVARFIVLANMRPPDRRLRIALATTCANRMADLVLQDPARWSVRGAVEEPPPLAALRATLYQQRAISIDQSRRYLIQRADGDYVLCDFLDDFYDQAPAAQRIYTSILDLDFVAATMKQRLAAPAVHVEWVLPNKEALWRQRRWPPTIRNPTTLAS